MFNPPEDEILEQIPKEHILDFLDIYSLFDRTTSQKNKTTSDMRRWLTQKSLWIISYESTSIKTNPNR